MFNFLKKLFGGAGRREARIEQPAPRQPQPDSQPVIKSLDLNIPDEALQDEARFAAYCRSACHSSVTCSKWTMIRAPAV